MTFLEKIKANFNTYKNDIAFTIDDISYTYNDFSKKVVAIQQLLLQNNIKKNTIVIVHTYNDIETYASIFAIWFSGAAFVPINPNHPKERNELIIKQISSTISLSSEQNNTSLCTKKLPKSSAEITILDNNLNQIMYILFTSGSTGLPKGVAITLKNISSFIVDFSKNYTINNNDKFLQIYDLTFDASIHCYLLPIYLGGSIYTVNPKKIKYLEAYKLMEKHQITFAKMPPSVIAYLKPFFSKINLPKLKYSLFGGEGLNFELVNLWQKCVPNAQVQNVYGPTEATINTHIFNIPKQLNRKKTYNGMVSIGKPFGSNKAIIVGENNQIVPDNVKGELCLYGNQITAGYWKNKAKNNSSFFKMGKDKVYKTGDLAFKDKDGDFIFCGRIDNQVQIQGHRVELSEVENAARQFKKALNYTVVSTKNKFGVIEIILFTEKLETDNKQIQTFLKQRLPNYMLPTKIINLEKFPLTSSGKIDNQNLISNYLN